MAKQLTAEEKIENRKKLGYFILSIGLILYSSFEYRKVEELLEKREINMKKLEYFFSESSIIRKEGFYLDNKYLESKKHLLKEWNDKGIGGISFNGDGGKSK